MTVKRTAVIGLQWGDEGKARVIDCLAASSDYVVRFQGGSNAGHTVVASGKKHVFHLVPSGMLHKGVRCLIGPGVVLDPWALREEVEMLEKNAGEIRNRISVSCGCHLVLPYHKRLDAALEAAKGDKKLGTTGRGIGPCYADRALRQGIRAGELLRPQHLRERLHTVVPIQNRFLQGMGDSGKPIDEDSLFRDLCEAGRWLEPMIADVPDIIMSAVRDGKSLLFEGAQSVLLDLDFGTYPYVTSSNSSLIGLHAGCGVHPSVVEEVWGVSKAYCTRVGEGPFVTEIFGAEAEMLRQAGGEYGATTGRPRRCGWIDLPALRYAVETSSVTHLALTKLDVLSGYPVIRVCTSYEGASHRIFHTDPMSVGGLRPVYAELPGWKMDIGGARRLEDLPSQARDLVSLVGKELGLPVRMISVGPSREQAILMK